MINSQTEKPRAFDRMGKLCSKFFLNRYFYLFLFCAACAVSVLEWEVYGAIAFVALICLTLVLCDDIMASALPLLLLCVFVTNCYDSADTFMKFAWMAIPAAAAIIFHFVAYRKKLVIGSSIWGLIAVSAALTLGGIGVLSFSEYFSPVAIYYTVFLGIGMVGLYFLLKSQLSAPRDYDVKEKAVLLLYIMGIFAAFVVLYNVLPDTRFMGGLKISTSFQASNNLSTILMFAMPCAFFYARRSKLHLLVALLMAVAMVLSGSRAGMLFAPIELLLCVIVSAVFDKKNRFYYVCLIIFAAVTVALFREKLYSYIVAANPPTIDDSEARIRLIARAKELFKKYPVFGHGLAYTGNFDIYSPKKGAMGWYHMMIPQVVASMGSVGIIAYVYQMVVQVSAGVNSMRRAAGDENERALIITLGLSYVGALMMSQVNPGIFCPIPYGLMATVIFALMDGDRGMEKVGAYVRRLKSKKAKKEEN